MGKLIAATGRRKTSSARVRLNPGTGKIMVNEREAKKYFQTDILMMLVTQPLKATNTFNKFDVQAIVEGGGLAGQAGALRHGIARALLEADEKLKSTLRKAGFLTRDPRRRERKKYGQKGARKRFQFSKR
jgi:small subunit ribosomal protein S9